MKYIYDSGCGEGMTLGEVNEYIRKCAVRQAEDTKAFLEILRLIEDEEIGAFDALVKIAGICKGRLEE